MFPTEGWDHRGTRLSRHLLLCSFTFSGLAFRHLCFRSLSFPGLAFRYLFFRSLAFFLISRNPSSSTSPSRYLFHCSFTFSGFAFLHLSVCSRSFSRFRSRHLFFCSFTFSALAFFHSLTRSNRLLFASCTFSAFVLFTFSAFLL